MLCNELEDISDKLAVMEKQSITPPTQTMAIMEQTFPNIEQFGKRPYEEQNLPTIQYRVSRQSLIRNLAPMGSPHLANLFHGLTIQRVITELQLVDLLEVN